MSDDILKGERTCMRSLERGDLERTWRWLHQPEIHERIGVKVPFSRTEQEDWFAAMRQSSDKCVFAVCRSEDQAHIGNVSLSMIDLRHRNGALSVFIADPELRGRGYGSDAVRVFVEYAFNALDLHRVWCKTDADDQSLERFYTALGFEVEGVLREHEYRNGSFVDKKIFGRVRPPA